ncbi:DeoR family transcriptional regulator [Pseudactinotalea sp. HY160]|uniref:DeoR/GlpR family DNA-binding transcription regulator n=1 Tax=Pseudactinotalea sp. HY160 TaxID=2654490 RepID=UPI00128E1AC6|nr:DeoR/GlpR family DNA-binding transcription regulator [Pseudactinotalea sp. HY160]MPV49703.1 DeoR family transcriptional regulator [Pseudactinotalea sp. HY160]
MLAATRRARIVDLVRSHRSISNDALASELDVSVETVRRDLDHLHRQGALQRVRGGAVRRRTAVSTEPSFPARQDLAAAEKNVIAHAAAALVAESRTVFLDIGTTAAAVATVLAPEFRGTVVTPSMRVAEILSESAAIEVLVPGGRVRGGDMSISGPTARAFLADINPDVTLLGTGGVDLEAGITDFELAEVDIKRVVMANSAHTYALADSSKVAVRAPYRVCDLSEVDAVVTDPGISESDRDAFDSHGIDVIVGPIHS